MSFSTTTYEPTPVSAFRGVAIFADYDGNAPDTEDLILCASQEVADEVCQILNEDTGKWDGLGFVDGYEWCKVFKTRVVLRTRADSFHKSVADVFANEERLNP